MSFDPYHRWLGIPPEEQPAHHYRLLGIKPFEDQPEVIESAADRQMVHLRNHQAGEHSDLSQKLLNEVAAARVCLLNPGKKADYDRALRERLEGAVVGAGLPTEALDPGLAQLFDNTAHAPAHAPAAASARAPQAARRAKQAQLWASIGIVAVGIVVLAIILIRAVGPSHETAKPEGGTPAVQPDGPKPPPPLPKPVPGATTQQPPQPKHQGTAHPPLPKDPNAPPLAVAPFDAAKAKEHQDTWAKHLGVPVVQTNSIGMKLVLIPPGEFEMGSPKELIEEDSRVLPADWYKERLAGEGPRHHVRISKPFYMGVTEVTQEEYRRVMGSNPSKFAGDPKRPVEQVSWDDSVEFCRRLSEEPGEKAANRRYALPTEAQWEYACCAGNPGRWWFSAQPKPAATAVEEKSLEKCAWLHPHAGLQTHPVAQMRANAWGLFDSYGNVWEWCEDWYDRDYYAKSPTDDPRGPSGGTHRVCRGASWNDSAKPCRSAYRDHNVPESRYGFLGFRVAMVPADKSVPPHQIIVEKPTPPQPPVEKPKRLPVPAQAERDKAIAQLNEVYELSKDRAPAEKRKLAADLLDLAEKAKERPAERYVLLENAVRLSGEGGDAGKMLELAGQIAAEFEIDPLAAKAAALKTFADGAKDSARIRALVEATERLIDESLALDKYDLAQELADRAYAACQATAGREFRKRAFDRRNEVQALAAAWKEVQAALEALKTDANDPGANLTAGRYFAFQKGDWRKGLAMLALGSDAALKDLAAKELKGAKSADEQLALADAWWDAAENAQGQERDAMRLHAGSWYQEAEAGVTSTLLKAKVQKRLEEIGKLGRPIPELPARKLPPAVAPFDTAKAKEYQQLWAKHLNVAVVETNSIGMKFALIPPGEFEMGSTEQETRELLGKTKEEKGIDWYFQGIRSEVPRHRVQLSAPFYLGLCEVTQDQYQQVMHANPSRFTSAGADAPVEQVTWPEAQEFCRALSRLAGEKSAARSYRLPTEAEWEYACRAGTVSRVYFAAQREQVGEFEWSGPNSGLTTHPVGRKKPNPWGLFDMLGNVREWCSDWYAPDYYAASPARDPAGPSSGTDRVLRGSSWNDSLPGLQWCAFRSHALATIRDPTYGIRVVCVPRAAGFGPQPSLQEVTAQTSAPTFGDWLQDFEAGKQKAARENKDILIAFDGSDWCSWSQRMASDVFLKPEFRQKADKDFVLVFIDFPAKAEAKARVQDAARNKKLAELFEVEGYPTVVLADALGRPYGVEGYVRGGVDAFAERLARWRAVKAKRDEAFAAVSASQPSAKLKAVRKAVAVLQEMDREVSGLGLMRFYEPALAEWLELAKKLDPANAAGDLEVVFSTVWMARLDAAGQHGDAKQLDEIVRQLDEWKKGFKFKDPDQAVMLYLRAAHVLLAAGRGTDAARFIEEATNYKPTDPALAWILERAARSMSEGFAFGHGTGFVVAAGGYILTNHHVIAGPGRLSVQLSPDPKDRVPAQVVAKDEKGDMALLKIDVPKGRTLTPLAISGAEVRRGMRIGAFGYGGAGDVGTGIKLTQGIVSSLPEKSTEGMIVLDCRVNPGNSGGPLCDTRGNVIGMIRAKSLSTEEFESYGMALPADNLKGFLARHLPKGHKAPEAPSSEKTREWDEIDRVVSGSVLKVVKGM